MKRISVLLGLAVLLLSRPGFAEAQPAPPPGALSRAGYLGLGLAGGFMIDPDMTAGMVSLDYYITEEISVGPYFQIGGSDDDRYWGVSGQVKFCAPLATLPEVRPFATAGIGFVELDFKDRDDDPEMTYFFPVGWGMEWELSDMISLESFGVYNLTEDVFVGLTVGVRIIL